MADHSENTNRDYDGAIRQYKEALQVHPEDEVKDEDILLILISPFFVRETALVL